eukprot:2548598-Pyramimonas_sp.AAC.2
MWYAIKRVRAVPSAQKSRTAKSGSVVSRHSNKHPAKSLAPRTTVSCVPTNRQRLRDLGVAACKINATEETRVSKHSNLLLRLMGRNIKSRSYFDA